MIDCETLWQTLWLSDSLTLWLTLSRCDRVVNSVTLFFTLSPTTLGVTVDGAENEINVTVERRRGHEWSAAAEDFSERHSVIEITVQTRIKTFPTTIGFQLLQVGERGGWTEPRLTHLHDAPRLSVCCVSVWTRPRGAISETLAISRKGFLLGHSAVTRIVCNLASPRGTLVTTSVGGRRCARSGKREGPTSRSGC